MMCDFRLQVFKSGCVKGQNSKNVKDREKGEHRHTIFYKL